MEITGQIIAILSKVTGQSAKGQWEKQEYVIEIPGKYPKKVCFTIFGADKIASINIQQGGNYTVSFDIDAREYKGRWFNSINAYAVTPAQQAQQGGYGQYQQYGSQSQYGGYQQPQQAYQPVASAPVITQAPVIAQAPPQQEQDDDALPF